MLPDTLIEIWRDASAIRTKLSALSPDQIQEAWQSFQTLSKLPPDEVRSKLAASEEAGNRRLAICLLARALDYFEANADEAASCAEWANFVAQFGGSLHNRGDAVEPDAIFLSAMSRHLKASSEKIWRSYNEAETLYRAAAKPLLVALSRFAQGWVALEAGLVEAVNSAYGGATEHFERALSALSPGDPHRAAFEQAIFSGQARSDAIDAALKNAHPLATLRRTNAPMDEHLRTMLRTRAVALSSVRGEANQAIVLARLADALSTGGGAAQNMRRRLAGTFLAGKSAAWAEYLYRELLRESPRDPEIIKGLARTLDLQGNSAEACSLLEELVTIEPHSADVHGALGMLLWQKGDHDTAAVHLRRSLEIDPSNTFYVDLLKECEPAVGIELRGSELVISGDATAVSPRDLAAGISVALLNQHPDLIPESLAKLDQDDPALAERVRHMLADRGLISALPVPNSLAHLKAAEDHFAAKHWEAAMAEYRTAIAADEDLAPAYTGLGDVYYNTGQYYLARAYFEESLEIRPDAMTFRFLGDTFHRTGQDKKAADAYRRALSIDPGYHGARVALQKIEAQEHEQ